MERKGRITTETSIVAPSEAQVFEEIFQFFKRQLANGELKPSDRLLSERELSQRLGVSRASLREAMRAMALLGVIEIRPGQGTFVRSPDLRILQDFFGVVLAMQPTVYDHVLEARVAIECHAVRLACLRAEAEDVRRLHAALQRVLDTVDDLETGAEADFKFHEAILRASHNEVLVFIHEAIGTLLRRSHVERRAAVIGQADYSAKLSQAHRRIVEAIVKRDPDRAEAEMREHFLLAQEQAVRQVLGSAPMPATGP